MAAVILLLGFGDDFGQVGLELWQTLHTGECLVPAEKEQHDGRTTVPEMVVGRTEVLRTRT